MKHWLLFAVLVMGFGCATSKADPRWEACVDEDAQQCMNWGKHSALDQKPYRALVAFQFACELGEADGCMEMAKFFGRIPENKAEMNQALRESCDKGEPLACVELAKLGPRRNAIPVFKSACEQGVGRGCAEWAAAKRDLWRLESELTESVRLDEKACELGVSSSCLRAGQAYYFGSGVPQDKPKSEAFFERSCNDETGDGCATLAKIFSEGVGVDPDPVKARQYYALAAKHQPQDAQSRRRSKFLINVGVCNRGDAIACYNAGLILQEGVEVDRNLTTAREFYNLSCQRGLERGCVAQRSIRKTERIAGTP